jgi:2-oxoglutarate ferredoxin oxidoreductase subunit alpha
LEERIRTGLHFVNGDEACAEGALAAGCGLFAGYPISPATEISEVLSKRLFGVGGIFVQGADELDSLAMVIGAACAGMKAMTATSGNGISLMQENIGYAAMTETPCVIVDVQRAGPGTGIATKSMQGDIYQVRYGSNSDYSIIALAPDSPQEMFDLTVEAFNLSEQYRVPTFVLADELVGHMMEKVEIPPADKIHIINRKKPNVPPDKWVPFKAPSDTDVPAMPSFGDGYAIPLSSFARNEAGSPSTNMQVQHQLVRRLWNKVEMKADQITRIETEHLEDADVAVLSYGVPARSVRRAVEDSRREGLKVGYVRLITIWPFPDKKIREIAEGVKTIIVAEMNMGKVVREVQRAAEGAAKVSLLSKPGVEAHTPQEVASALRGLVA